MEGSRARTTPWSTRRARPARAALFALALLVATHAGHAQDKSTYPTVRNPERFNIDWRRFYDRADAMTTAARRSLPHHLDLAYGSDPKQRLDLYLPHEKPSRPVPVFVFLHGGGFREGDRAHYGFVARPLAAHGIATIVASYRLYPRRYPDQVDDTRRVLAWTRANAAARGLDADRVYIGGHSAGAILSALVGVKTDWNDDARLPADFVKGIAPVSGPYDLREAKGFVSDFVEGSSERTAASPVLNIARTPPAVVALGSGERAYLEGSRAFVEELKRRGGRAELLVLEGMGHDGSALTLGDEQSPLVAAIVRMIRMQ